MPLSCSTAREAFAKIRTDLSALQSLTTADMADKALQLMEHIEISRNVLGDALWPSKAQRSIDRLIKESGRRIESFKIDPKSKTISRPGDLNLGYCSITNSLPSNFHIGGDLDLMGCTLLTQLPPNLAVGGALILHRCNRLRELSEDLYVFGDLRINECPLLKKLPDRMYVDANLILKNCPLITTLPSDLFVRGDVFIPERLHADALKLKERRQITGSIITNRNT